MSSLTLPNVDTLLAERHTTRTSSWDKDFETNHPAFADKIAQGIYKKVLEELGDRIKDPFKRTMDTKNKYVYSISLEISSGKSSKELKGLVGSEELPPFTQWLSKFTPEEKKSNDYDFYTYNRDIDDEYFDERMAIVGRIAMTKLNELFSTFISKPEYQDLKFKVELTGRDEMSSGGLSSGSGFKRLSVDFWIGENAIKTGQGDGPEAVQKLRTERQQKQSKELKYTVLFAIVAIVSFYFFQSGFKK